MKSTYLRLVWNALYSRILRRCLLIWWWKYPQIWFLKSKLRKSVFNKIFLFMSINIDLWGVKINFRRWTKLGATSKFWLKFTDLKRHCYKRLDIYQQHNLEILVNFYWYNIFFYVRKCRVLSRISVLTLKIKFTGIFIIIFVISASKYVSFKLIEGKCFSEVHLDNFPILTCSHVRSFIPLHPMSKGIGE